MTVKIGDNINKQNKDGCEVFVFTLSTCVHCKKLKKYLKSLNVEFNYVDLDNLDENDLEEVLNTLSKYNPAETFPTLVVKDKVIVGFREDEIRRLLQKFNFVS